MRPFHHLTRVIFLFCIMLQSSMAAPGPDEWPSLAETDLRVARGSALDFSAIHELRPIEEADRLIISSDGKFIRQKDGKRVRLFIASLGIDAGTGRFPPPEDIEAYVEQLLLRGYNAVRIDSIEYNLMFQRNKDFDYDPDQLDRFYRLMAALKKAGLYSIINLMTSGNGAYGNVEPRWISRKSMGSRIYHDPEARAHWQTMVQTLYFEPNPYTKIPLLLDPSVAGVAIANENGISFISRNGPTPALTEDFQRWKSESVNSSALLFCIGLATLCALQRKTTDAVGIRFS
jgi:hypothetical protein